MKITLNIKNMSKLKAPTRNDVIVYDGVDWYVTTKDDLLKEIKDLTVKNEKILEEIKKEKDNFKTEVLNDVKDFKLKVSQDIYEITDTIKKLYTLKGEKL